MIAGQGEAGETAAKAIASDTSLMSEEAPKPGEGPTKEERETGFYDILFLGETTEGKTLKAAVTGDKDPGYGSTSKMIAESAICLVRERKVGPGGVMTTAPAMGGDLIARLQKNAGLTFRIEN